MAVPDQDLRPWMIWILSFICLNIGDIPRSPEKMRSGLQEILHHPDHRVFLIQDKERVTGWIHGFYSIHMESGPYIEIAGMVVRPVFPENGHGQNTGRENN